MSDIGLLEQQRENYMTAGTAAKQRMSAAILALESKVEAEHEALARMELEIRRIEQEKLYK